MTPTFGICSVSESNISEAGVSVKSHSAGMGDTLAGQIAFLEGAGNVEGAGAPGVGRLARISPDQSETPMRKLVAFMHISLDGYAAGPNGEMDWIHVDEEMFESAGHRTDHADTALYGRVTYDMMEQYWPTAADQPNATKHDIEHGRWYNSVAKVVVSRTLKGTNPPGTTIVDRNAARAIAKLKKGVGRDIVMFGSPSIAHLLTAARLIDDYWLFVNPVLLGTGIPMFKRHRDRAALDLVAARSFQSGVVSLHYTLQPSGERP